MPALVNHAVRPAAVPARSDEARAFHQALEGYAPTPLHELPDAAAEPREFCARVARSLEYEIAVLTGRDPAERLAARHARYRTLGARPC